MSDVLDAVRQKYPAYKDVPDDKLIKAIGDKFPQYLDKDKDFKREYSGLGREALPATPGTKEGGNVPLFTPSAPIGMIPTPQTFTKTKLSGVQEQDIMAKGLTASPVPTLPTIQEKPATQGEKMGLAQFAQTTPGMAQVPPLKSLQPGDISDTSVAVARRTANLPLGLAGFAASPQGVAAGVVSTVAPTLTSLGFTLDMVHGAYEQAKQAHANWDKMGAPQKAEALIDIAGNMVMAGLLGKHTKTEAVEYFQKRKEAKANAEAIRSNKGQVQGAGGQQPGVQDKGGQNIQQPASLESESVGAREGKEAKVPLKDRPYVVAHQEETGEYHVGREDDAGVVQPEHTFDNQEEAQKTADRVNAEMKATGGKTKKTDVEHVMAHLEKNEAITAYKFAKSKRWTKTDPQTKQRSPDLERARAALAEAEKQGLISRPDENSPYVKTGKKLEETDQPFALASGKEDPKDYEPALMINGKPVTGGRTHADIAAAQIKTGDRNSLMGAMNALRDDTQHVFVDKKGNVFTRADMARKFGSDTPMHSQQLRDMQDQPLARIAAGPNKGEGFGFGQFWMDKDGKLHKADGGHEAFAERQVKKNGVQESPYLHMQKNGWARVYNTYTDINGTLETVVSGKPSDKQLSELKNLAIETGRRLTWDDGSRNGKTIYEPPPTARGAVPSELPKPIEEVMPPEMHSMFDEAAKALGVELEHVDTMDPHSPWSRILGNFGIATIDRAGDKVIINTRLATKWLQERIRKQDWNKAIKSIVAQERNHMFTPGELAEAFWKSLTGPEQAYYRNLYSNGGAIDISDMNDRMLGYEAVNMAMQDLARMPTSEYLALGRGQRLSVQATRVILKIAAHIRKVLAKIPILGEQHKAMLELQKSILDSIESKSRSLSSESPLARIAKRKESKEQETFLLPGSETVKTAKGEARTVRKELGETSKPTEAVPEEERKVALQPKPAPMTGKELQDTSAAVVDKMFKDSAAGQAPRFSDFEEAVRKKEPRIQPGQLFDMWQDAVSKRLENASDEDIRNLTKAVLVPKESSTGLRNRWEAMANALLTYNRERGVESLKQPVFPSLPGVESGYKEKKYTEKYAAPKIGEPARNRKSQKLAKGTPELPMEVESKEQLKNVHKAVKPERDLGEEAAVRQDLKDEKAVARRRKMLANELFKRMVIPRIEKADLHRNEITLDDIRWGGGKLIAAVHNFPADAWKNTHILGQELLDESKRAPSDPNTYTRRLTLIQDKGSGKVSLVSTYRRAGEAMLLDPHHPQKHHLPLRQMIGRYRIIQSLMLDEPVQKFKQTWDSLQDYQDDFGRDAKETNDTHTSEEGIYGMTHRAETHTAQGQRLTQVTGENEGVPGSMVEEGASGHLQGPFRSEIEASTGGARGTLNVSRRAPVTTAEATALTSHIASELGKAPDSPEDVRLVLDELKQWRRPNPSVVSALRKLAAIVEREQDIRQRQHVAEAKKGGVKVEPTPLSVDYLMDKLAQYIYEDKNLEKTLADAAKIASAAPKATPGVATPATGRASSARELTLPINRRPPTDVIGMPPGTPRPMPEATANPVLHTLLTAPDIEHVNKMAAENNPYEPTNYIPLAQRKWDARKARRAANALENKGEDQPLARAASPGQAQIEHATAELDKKRRQMVGYWGRRGLVRDIKMDRDGLDNIGATIREGTKLSLRNVVVTGDKAHDEFLRETPIAMLGALKEGQNPKSGKKFVFYDLKVLERMVNDATTAGIKAENMLNEPKVSVADRHLAREWKKSADRLLKVAIYTRDHWQDKDVRDMAQAVRAELADQLYREHSGGVNTTDFGLSYIPSPKEGEFFNLNSVTFGDDPVIGNRFSKKKTFRDAFEAIRTGPYIPKSYDTSITVSHRVGVGMNAINRNAFIESFKTVKDADSGLPILVNAVPIDPHMSVREDTGEKEFNHAGWQPHDPRYELVRMGGGDMPVSVLKPYARTWSLIFAKSGFENSVLGEGAIYGSSMLKHGVVLVVDTFHPSRLGQYAAALSHPKDVPGLMRRSFSKRGGAWTALFYRPQDLDLAVQNGLIHPEAAAWAREKMVIGNELYTKQEVLHMMVKHGLNASRIGDALYKDAVERIPLVGKYLYHGLDEPGIRSEAVPKWIRDVNLKNFNGWMFDRLLPSLISETAVRNFETLHKANPNVPTEKLMRDVITDINTIYGNMGRQGVFAHPTMRDVAQVFLLAPAWQEGLVGKEMKMAGRLTGISNLTGRRGLPQFGALGKFMGRGLAAYFIATQLINLITRRQLTFQNESPHQLDAWIPTGKNGVGVWLSPLSIFGETIHDFTRLYETNHSAWKTVKRIGLNKLGPVGRFANVLASGTSSQGTYLSTTGAVIGSALSELAPAPISLGTPLRLFGSMLTSRISPPEPGAASRQAFATLGIKVQAQADNINQMKNLAMQYVHDNHLRPDEAQIAPTDEPSYSRLRHAVRIGDYRAAGIILDQLQKMHSGSDTPTIQAMSNWVSRPMTGGGQSEAMWLSSLSPKELDQYQKAVQTMQQQYQNFLSWYFKYRNPGSK